MKTYETLLIGCSYSSVGYALAEKNTLIVEENEMADTRFYLPLKSYKTTTYQPTTSHGEKLLECINSLGLIQNGVINANGLECAFCDFISQNQLDIIFKSRIINSEWQNDHFCSQIITNSGIITVKSKKIIDTRVLNPQKTTLTVLLKGNLSQTESQLITSAFANSYIENTLYTDVFSLFLEQSSKAEYNQILKDFYATWKNLGATTKVLYIAPLTASKSEMQQGFPKDEYFDNPIKALEMGYAFCKKRVNL